jgi:hypothetical protein
MRVSSRHRRRSLSADYAQVGRGKRQRFLGKIQAAYSITREAKEKRLADGGPANSKTHK